MFYSWLVYLQVEVVLIVEGVVFAEGVVLSAGVLCVERVVCFVVVEYLGTAVVSLVVVT